MRRLDRFATLLLLAMALWAFFGEEREPAPPPRSTPPPVLLPPELPPAQPIPPTPQPQDRAVLPPPSPRDPVFDVAPGPNGGTSSGTAFSMNPSGLWLTAKHVVNGCRRVGIRERQGWVQASVAWAHPGADIALIQTRGGTPGFALSGDAPTRGMDAFGIGYPQGRPGAVQGRLLGRAQMQARRLFKGLAPTLEWAEVRRVPNFGGSLGGISGGPLFDANGNVLGVMVAEQPRRGRFSTAAPETLLAMAGSQRPLPIAGAGTRAVAISPGGLGTVADRLRGELRVAQVLCQG
ncbi:S1 family peptidase [Elioraea rosea]|uniref:S1 family peptidase n=1 Tax=Elioraea rosea TaxID=2492390 RepID=UPI001183D6D9|nr:serine protease [Elioraea rosea]